ncbi:F-box-like domain superfamily [Arabidopsis thaliana x Arabidopsis arenosa]|uniref:F-box-like domain superfamily n=1 Tax=Arabidopsis thaliana x Arabidopsis arenosa TaxID=1240361 RepID=A0A8T1ZKY7_9BRAS|nr:F-box-like domain superfamily [Arabidopsis thaliana x Arabidopsis arenosa]
MYLPEPVTVMFFERLRIRDIAKLRSVCREWKSLLESSYFRDLYRTINHRNLSSPWSILYIDQYSNTLLEFFYEKWGLKQSLGSCVSRFLHEVKAANNNKRMGALAITDGLILLGVSTNSGPNMFCVANPVLRQWITIPQPPPCCDGFLGAGLVSDMNNGDLLGYKVVRYGLSGIGSEWCSLFFQIYSSDSGYWTYHYVSTERSIEKRLPSNPISSNGYLHWLCRATQVIFAYDFYAPTEFCRVIDLPQGSAKTPVKADEETLTISCGSLMYMNIDTGRPNQQLKIWRLKNYMSDSSKESWELLWNLMPGLDLGLATVPVAMHPFDKEIVYLVTRKTRYSRKHAYLVSCNLGTKKFQIHKGWKQRHREFGDYQSHLFHQFVLPQRLGSFPCPPGCTLVTLPDPH